MTTIIDARGMGRGMGRRGLYAQDGMQQQTAAPLQPGCRGAGGTGCGMGYGRGRFAGNGRGGMCRNGYGRQNRSAQGSMQRRQPPFDDAG